MNNSLFITPNLMNCAPKDDTRDKRMRGRRNTIGRQDDVVVVIRAERICQSSSASLVVARVVKVSGGQVEKGLLQDDGD